ncbi:hypothetical protein IFM89_000863 [Coptis chinensis]|uniref:TCP domain-containing protein n=1 Tax=Coptis chinensis TaxID=261450 RepID=A0A835IKH7_9MAGN|nr:hypothetical protein IFM89_000863 [Coptis chinensis]
MYTSNNFVDQNDMFFEFSPTFLDHDDYSFFQFVPQEQLMEIVAPSRESVEETMINKAVSSTTINLRDALHNGNGGSCKKVYRMSGKNPRKRSGKKDRHSKIVTAQGTRDRRMRLSLEIARKFFNLQDTLGFEKASKTVEWLLRQAEEAIHELGERCTGDTKSVSCSTECDVVSEIDEGQNVIFKAKSLDRAVSREKTKNKSSCRTTFYQNNFVTSQGQSSNNNNNNNISLPTIPENWSIDFAKLHASYWANLSVGNVQDPIASLNFLTTSAYRLQSQTVDLNQFYGKPW